MRQREETLGKMANAHVAAHMETILKQALTNWSMQVQSQLGGQMPGGAPGAGHPAPQHRATGPQRRLGITGPQPVLNNQNGAGYGNGRGREGKKGRGKEGGPGTATGPPGTATGPGTGAASQTETALGGGRAVKWKNG